MPVPSKPCFASVDVEALSKAGQSASSSLFDRAKAELVTFVFTRRDDICRTVPLRLLGYGYAVAEAIRHRLSHEKGDPFSMIATAFITFHCAERALAVAQNKESLGTLWPGQNELSAIVIVFCDTFIWEVFASVIIPTFMTYCVVSLTDSVLSITWHEDSWCRKWLPVLAGIAILPLFMNTVDNFVDKLLDETIREIYFPSSV